MVNFETLSAITTKPYDRYKIGEIAWSFNNGFLYIVEKDSSYYGRSLTKARNGQGTSYPLYTAWKIGDSINAYNLIPVNLKKNTRRFFK